VNQQDQRIRVGIIGGSGLGDALGAEQGESHWPDTPYGRPSSPLTRAHVGDCEVVWLARHGHGHVHPPSRVPYRANIFALKAMGVTHVLASGAVGSLRETIAPGHLVIPDQIIDKTSQRSHTFYEQASVHVEFSEPFCPVMRQWLLEAAAQLPKLTVHDGGVYICMEGPALSTRAESRMHQAWGGDLIGMTVMPEAKLAREAEMAYAMVCLSTDYDCWHPHDPALGQTKLLEQIIATMHQCTQGGLTLMRHALTDTQTLHQPSPAHDALKLGIWSDKSRIPAEAIETLRPLWGRYFSQQNEH